MTDTAAPVPELDTDSIVTLVGGLAIVVVGLAVVLTAPQARTLCGRILRDPEVQKTGGKAAGLVLSAVAASLGWRIERKSAFGA